MKCPRKKTTIKEIKCSTCGGDAEFVTVLELVPPGFTRKQTCYVRCDFCLQRWFRKHFQPERTKARK